MSLPQGAVGQKTVHSVPSVPIGPFAGRQVSGCWHPLAPITGQAIMSAPHGCRAEGHMTGHSTPSLPTGPIKKWHILQHIGNFLQHYLITFFSFKISLGNWFKTSATSSRLVSMICFYW